MIPTILPCSFSRTSVSMAMSSVSESRVPNPSSMNRVSR
jgi:hypothetical protein